MNQRSMRYPWLDVKTAYISLLAIRTNMMFSLIKKTIINAHAYVKMTVGIPGFQLMTGFVEMEKQNEQDK